MQVTLKSGEEIDIPDNALPILVIECGSCGHYHLKALTGDIYLDDCRNDTNRYNWEELDELFGEDGWLDEAERD